MINKTIDYFKNLDKLTYKIIKKGLVFCLILSLISAFILFTYSSSFLSPSVYYIGLSLFKSSCMFSVEFIVCGLVMDTVKKQLI